VRYQVATAADTLTLDMVDAADVSAPALIGELDITVLGSRELALSWPAASEDGAPAPSARCLIWASNTRALPDETLPFAAAGPGATGLLLGGLTPGSEVSLTVAAVDAAGNSEASAMLERDVGNLAAYFGRFAPQLLASEYGKEIWALYQAGLLVPGAKLSGRFAADERRADPEAVLRELALARKEAREEAALRLAEQA